MRIDDVRAACVELLERQGVPADEASLLVGSLVSADLKGVSSHGLQRLAIYVRRIKVGLLQARAEITVERDRGAIAVLNGNFSVAQVVAYRAMEAAIEKAARSGIGAVLAINSGHFGMASEYGLQAAARRMIGVVTSNVTPLMPAPGGATKIIGNNPLAIVAPTAGNPIVADMAMSHVAAGKLHLAKARGEKIPLDWAVDGEGRPTDDPAKGLDGMMLPMSGPKGYSLAVGLETLTGVLGGCFAWHVSTLYDLSRKHSTAHMMIAVDVDAFVPWPEYLRRVEELRAGIKESPKAAGVAELFLPGEIEFARQERALASGEMDLPESVRSELGALMREVGMKALGS